MSRKVFAAILSVSALWQLSSAEPADPTITAAAVLPRQNSDTFIGFLEVNNTWTSLNCNSGLTWYQSGPYAQCCPTTLASCYAPTACVSGSQIYTYPDISSVRTIACTENYNNAALSICNTIFIFENTQDSNPKTNINCGDSSANWSYYRDVPATEIVDTDPVSSGLPTTAPSGPAQTSESESGSKAWIAGAVVGPILGLALVGVGVWFLLRRRKKAAQVPQHGTASMAPIDPSQPPAGVGGYTDAKPQAQTAQPTYFNQPDPYAQQGYPPQGGFSPQGSPAPQYGFQSAYNATANSPPGAYTHDAKYESGTAAELGGESTRNAATVPDTSAAPQQDAAPASHVAELSGADVRTHGGGLQGSGKPQ